MKDVSSGVRAIRLPAWSLPSLAVLLAFALLRGPFLDRSDWALIGILSSMALLLGALERGSRFLPWLATAAAGVALLTWTFVRPVVEWVHVADAPFQPNALVTGLVGALFVIGAYGRLWRSERPVGWARLAGAALVWFFLVALVGRFWTALDDSLSLRFRSGEAPWVWPRLALALAAVAALSAVPVRSRLRRPEGDRAAQPLLAASLAMLAIGAALWFVHLSLRLSGTG